MYYLSLKKEIKKRNKIEEKEIVIGIEKKLFNDKLQEEDIFLIKILKDLKNKLDNYA